MNSTHLTPDRAQAALPFVSLASFRAAHNQLLTVHRQAGNTPPLLAASERFIEQGRTLGALLDNEEERTVAQSALDYWAAILYRSGTEPPESALAEFDWSLAPELADELCPYVGLDAFAEQHHALFFGRERLIQEALRNLERSRLLAVVGPSGSGKSSLVLAGLLPALKSAATPGSAPWRYAPRMVPGSEPLLNLARVLGALQADPATDPDRWNEQCATRLAAAPEQILDLIDQQGAPLLLMVDQFEEIFTLCVDDAARRAFIACLMSLCQTPGRRHTLILTMRADFENLVSRLPDFQVIFERHLFRVTPLNAAELRASIEAPADLIGLKFEQGLVDALLNDILGEPAALPLLQFTLLKLWEHRQHNYITWDAFQRLGGGRLALANSADAFYQSLIPEEQLTARRILLRMVRASDGLEITSSRVRLDSLHSAGEAQDRVDRVLDKLICARLVRLTQGDVASDSQVEIAHEALVRNWPTLVAWLEEERDKIRQRQRLTDAAQHWVTLERAPGALLPATLLHEAARFVETAGMEPSVLEAEFLQASQQALAAEQRRELARQAELQRAQMEAQQQAGKARRLRRLAQALSLLLTIPLLALVLSVQQRRSLWQPLQSFPRDMVPALAASWISAAGQPDGIMICAGTSNIGIGCTQEGRTWNIFQQDLPTGEPARPTGSEFSGAVRGVQAISIDATNRQRIMAFFWDGNAYLSEDGGVRWRLTSQGLPADPSRVSAVALHDHLALAIVDAQLYGSQDSGASWSSVSQFSQPFWGAVHDVSIDASSGMAYAATDNGVYLAQRHLSRRWERIIDLPNVQRLVKRASGGEELLIVARGPGDQDILYRWRPDQPARPLAVFTDHVQTLAADPNRGSGVAAYVLLNSGEVVAISDRGVKHSLGRRPGWPWEQSLALLVVPSQANTTSTLLLGHTNGLLRFDGSFRFPAP
jgi:energy-coupling factor transporter ATP-binding protein EcfA2